MTNKSIERDEAAGEKRRAIDKEEKLKKRF